ncbi:MAG: hypothetical protein AVDCRST_MAG66-4739, partial [uncultured Pseudonocardia sp.]
ELLASGAGRTGPGACGRTREPDRGGAPQPGGCGVRSGDPVVRHRGATDRGRRAVRAPRRDGAGPGRRGVGSAARPRHL